MNSIETFNHLLNQSTSERYLAWKDYRNDVTRIVLDAIGDNEVSNVCIIGAGSLNDLDLSAIQKRTNRLILSDIDLEHVKDGLDRQAITDPVELVRVDYTGLEKELFFDELDRYLENGRDFSFIKEYIDRVFDRISDYQFLKQYQQTMDVVIVLPIYTQLVIPQLTSVLERHYQTRKDPLELNYIPDYILGKMVALIGNINDQIGRLLNDEGQLVMFSDFFEAEADSLFLKQFEQNIDRQDFLDGVYQDYHKNYGYGLGDYGLDYFLDDFVSVFTKWMIWPFDEKRSMIVKSAIYKKEKGGEV